MAISMHEWWICQNMFVCAIVRLCERNRARAHTMFNIHAAQKVYLSQFISPYGRNCESERDRERNRKRRIDTHIHRTIYGALLFATLSYRILLWIAHRITFNKSIIYNYECQFGIHVRLYWLVLIGMRCMYVCCFFVSVIAGIVL